MKRIRYECEKCGAEHDVRFHSWETHPRRMTCVTCLEKNAMVATYSTQKATRLT